MRRIGRKKPGKRMTTLQTQGTGKDGRKKAGGYLVSFLLFMLLCTMISRGIYAYRMPRVVTGQASSKTISHTIQAEGTMEAAGETAVVLAQGIRIREICVKTGEKVEPDMPLLVLDEEDLHDLMETTGEKIRVAEENIAAFSQSDPAGQGNLLEQQYALKHLQKQYAEYQKLWKKKGRIESGREGYITEIYVQAGDRTPDSAVMLFADCSDDADDADGSGKWIFRASLTQEQADVIKAGDLVRLQFRNGSITVEDCMVSAVRKTETGTFEAVVAVTKSGLAPGETGTLEMTSQSGQYSCCVPLSAVYSDTENDYILLIRETETILGTELQVVRRNVTVLDQNESTAALADGTLGAEDLFVAYADKEAASGDKVRLFEEEDIYGF